MRRENGLQIFVAGYLPAFLSLVPLVNLAVPIAKTHDDAGESCDPEMLKYLTEAPEEEAEDEAPPSSPFKDVFKGFNLEN